MNNSKEQEPKWNEQLISCGPFEGIIRIKESILGNGHLHTHIVYSLSDGEHTICGIGNDINEVQRQILEQANMYLMQTEQPEEND